MDQLEIAELLRRYRARRRLTQREMAGLLGVDRELYKNWEYGTNPPKPIMAKLMTMGVVNEVGQPGIPAGELEVPLPYIGNVAAGEQVNWTDPLEAEAFEYVPSHMAEAKNLFVCNVATDCMVPLLEPGDLCIWKADSAPQIGTVVLFRSEDNRVTIKQLKHDGRDYFLHPLNSRYEDSRAEGVCVGYLIGLRRTIGRRVITDHDPSGIRP